MKGRAYQVGGRRFDGQIEEWPALGVVAVIVVCSLAATGAVIFLTTS